MNEKKVIDMMYAGKKAYVEDILGKALKPLEDFGKIEYARDAITNEEYIRLTETIGSVYFLNVTGASEDLILKAVCRLVLEDHPAELIRTRERQRDACRLFR